MTKILTSNQLRAADAYTIMHEPIASIDLMERAAGASFHWMRSHLLLDRTIRIFCGPGNNGGDGAVIARLLAEAGYPVNCYTFGDKQGWSAELKANISRCEAVQGVLSYHIHDVSAVPVVGSGELWIDALFGTGLSRPLSGIYADVVGIMNASQAEILSIDLPSGLMADRLPENSDNIIKARHTLTFHSPKLTFFLVESGLFAGAWYVLDIGLHQGFIDGLSIDKYTVDESWVRDRFKVRQRFSHKGTYGHGLLVAGSAGKFGAAILSAKGALRSGIGLLSVLSAATGEHILQTSVPEAMFIRDSGSDHIRDVIPADGMDAVAIGPGCGQDESTAKALDGLLKSYGGPMVLDADALNILSFNRSWLDRLPPSTVLTPHPKEFERMTQPVLNDFERLELQCEFAKRYGVVLVGKGAYTRIIAPDGTAYFNTTGNAGLARGGSGDLLTGMILSFLAQGYPALEAAALGVFFHGKAADEVLTRSSMQSLSVEEIIEALPSVFASFERN